MLVNLIVWQTIYVLSGIVILPFAPFLYLRKANTCAAKSDAPARRGGRDERKFGAESDKAKLLVIANRPPPASARANSRNSSRRAIRPVFKP
jgi:hypothetical protein